MPPAARNRKHQQRSAARAALADLDEGPLPDVAPCPARRSSDLLYFARARRYRSVNLGCGLADQTLRNEDPGLSRRRPYRRLSCRRGRDQRRRSTRSEDHTSELQSRREHVCRLLRGTENISNAALHEPLSLTSTKGLSQM